MKQTSKINLYFSLPKEIVHNLRDVQSRKRWKIMLQCLANFIMLAGFAACASYAPLPLARTPDLAPGLAALNLTLPAVHGKRQRIDITRPLSIDNIGLLAILNDPDLRDESGQAGQAEAALIQESLLPNPSVSLGYAAVLSGAASTPSYAASLSQDVTALVTYRARTAAAEVRVAQVNADLLWREWQVAQKARLLALDIYWTGRRIALNAKQSALFSDEVSRVKKAVHAGDLDLAALTPLLAAKTAAEQAVAALKLERLKNWQALNALLGLIPDARFAIAKPTTYPVPSDIDSLLASLPARRPDLVALQLGYRSSDKMVRAAILGQFPAFVLGGTWGSDTSSVVSAGPQVSFDLPIFNRNQGRIAAARATRQVLHAQYLSRLDKAVGHVRALASRSARLTADLAWSRSAAAQVRALAESVKTAYAQGNIDQRTFAEYQTTALARENEAAAFQRSLEENNLILKMELGLGLPAARLAPVTEEKQ
jgi:outer membrane protein TolC